MLYDNIAMGQAKTPVSQFLTLSKSTHISVDIMTTLSPTYASYTAHYKTHHVTSRTARLRLSEDVFVN